MPFPGIPGFNLALAVTQDGIYVNYNPLIPLIQSYCVLSAKASNNGFAFVYTTGGVNTTTGTGSTNCGYVSFVSSSSTLNFGVSQDGSPCPASDTDAGVAPVPGWTSSANPTVPSCQLPSVVPEQVQLVNGFVNSPSDGIIADFDIQANSITIGQPGNARATLCLATCMQNGAYFELTSSDMSTCYSVSPIGSTSEECGAAITLNTANSSVCVAPGTAGAETITSIPVNGTAPSCPTASASIFYPYLRITDVYQSLFQKLN
jgi:hypothetical protein